MRIIANVLPICFLFLSVNNARVRPASRATPSVARTVRSPRQCPGISRTFKENWKSAQITRLQKCWRIAPSEKHRNIEALVLSEGTDSVWPEQPAVLASRRDVLRLHNLGNSTARTAVREKHLKSGSGDHQNHHILVYVDAAHTAGRTTTVVVGPRDNIVRHHEAVPSPTGAEVLAITP